MPRKSERSSRLCPRCGQAPTAHTAAACRVPPEVTARLLAFKRAHGVRWKSELCELWLQGRDWNDSELRRARNLIGASDLYKIKL
jgi:hypothetical protein